MGDLRPLSSRLGCVFALSASCFGPDRRARPSRVRSSASVTDVARWSWSITILLEVRTLDRPIDLALRVPRGRPLDGGGDELFDGDRGHANPPDPSKVLTVLRNHLSQAAHAALSRVGPTAARVKRPSGLRPRRLDFLGAFCSSR